MSELCALNGFYTASQLARWQEAIPTRVSCRAYSGAPTTAQRGALSFAAARVCLRGVRVEMADCPEGLFLPVPIVGAIKGAARYAAFIVDRGVRESLLHAGISGEAFILEATSLGLGTCWVSGSFRRARVDIPLRAGEEIAAVTPIGIPAQGAAERGHKRKELAALCAGDVYAWPVWAAQAARNVRLAPSALNRQPWRLSYAGRTLKLEGAEKRALDLGIAVLHMEAAVAGMPHRWRFFAGGDIARLTAGQEETHDAL